MATEQLTPATESAAIQKRGFPLNLWHISLFLIFLGTLVSGYLTYVKFTAEPMMCIEGSVFNCTTVQNSAWASIMGVPIAYLGLAMYLFLGAITFFEQKGDLMQENGLLLQFIVGLFAWLYSMWLVYVQVALLQALCQWCLMHELIITILFGIICFRLWRSLRTV